jgi:hypothetical protein
LSREQLKLLLTDEIMVKYFQNLDLPNIWTQSFLTSSSRLLGGSAFQGSMQWKGQQMAMPVIKSVQPITHELGAG